jgi:flavin-dependent dehydrogenase
LTDVDVLIVGAGPAGCAAAISLADFAPELNVCLVDAAMADAARIGETVPPQIKPILEHLGLWPAFAGDGHGASYRTLSAWGTPRLLSNEFLFHAQQVGWRLDRSRFDAMFLAAAKARVAAHVANKVVHLAVADGIWRVRLGDGTTHTARAVVDATGRAAVLARLHGLRPTRLDRLVGAFMYFDDPAASAQDLVIEAVRDGWWYTTALPAGRRVAAFMTDADLARRLEIGQLEPWLQAFRATDHVAAAASRARPLGQPRLHGAGSQMLAGDTLHPLLCVGDAASCFDPVSGQGIVKALRSAIFASYAIGDWLNRNDSGGLQRYRAFIKAEFAAYRRTLHEYYASERRWPASAFWQRRHAPSTPPRDRQAAPALFVPVTSSAAG